MNKLFTQPVLLAPPPQNPNNKQQYIFSQKQSTEFRFKNVNASIFKQKNSEKNIIPARVMIQCESTVDCKQMSQVLNEMMSAIGLFIHIDIIHTFEDLILYSFHVHYDMIFINFEAFLEEEDHFSTYDTFHLSLSSFIMNYLQKIHEDTAIIGIGKKSNFVDALSLSIFTYYLEIPFTFSQLVEIIMKYIFEVQETSFLYMNSENLPKTERLKYTIEKQIEYLSTHETSLKPQYGLGKVIETCTFDCVSPITVPNYIPYTIGDHKRFSRKNQQKPNQEMVVINESPNIEIDIYKAPLNIQFESLSQYMNSILEIKLDPSQNEIIRNYLFNDYGSIKEYDYSMHLSPYTLVNSQQNLFQCKQQISSEMNILLQLEQTKKNDVYIDKNKNLFYVKNYTDNIMFDQQTHYCYWYYDIFKYFSMSISNPNNIPMEVQNTDMYSDIPMEVQSNMDSYNNEGYYKPMEFSDSIDFNTPLSRSLSMSNDTDQYSQEIPSNTQSIQGEYFDIVENQNNFVMNETHNEYIALPTTTITEGNIEPSSIVYSTENDFKGYIENNNNLNFVDHSFGLFNHIFITNDNNIQIENNEENQEIHSKDLSNLHIEKEQNTILQTPVNESDKSMKEQVLENTINSFMNVAIYESNSFYNENQYDDCLLEGNILSQFNDQDTQILSDIKSINSSDYQKDSLFDLPMNILDPYLFSNDIQSCFTVLNGIENDQYEFSDLPENHNYNENNNTCSNSSNDSHEDDHKNKNNDNEVLKTNQSESSNIFIKEPTYDINTDSTQQIPLNNINFQETSNLSTPPIQSNTTSSNPILYESSEPPLNPDQSQYMNNNFSSNDLYNNNTLYQNNSINQIQNTYDLPPIEASIEDIFQWKSNHDSTNTMINSDPSIPQEQDPQSSNDISTKSKKQPPVIYPTTARRNALTSDQQKYLEKQYYIDLLVSIVVEMILYYYKKYPEGLPVEPLIQHYQKNQMYTIDPNHKGTGNKPYVNIAPRYDASNFSSSNPYNTTNNQPTDHHKTVRKRKNLVSKSIPKKKISSSSEIQTKRRRGRPPKYPRPIPSSDKTS